MSIPAGRRSFLKAGSVAVVGAALPGRTAWTFAEQRPRIGIIGGGLAGVSCAWLLDAVADCVLFEDRPSLGGNANTIPVLVGGRWILVDVGAQFFSGGSHPTYTRLLEIIGLLDPDRPQQDATIDAQMTITLGESGVPLPRFVSPAAGRLWPLLASWNQPALGAFLVFSQAAKQLCQDGDWLLPLDAWLTALPVAPEQREGLLRPLVAAMVGCSLEQTGALSARSAVTFVGSALPDNPLEPFRYSNSLLGLGGNVQYLAGLCHNLISHAGSPVVSLEPRPPGGYFIRNAAGTSEPVDAVIFAAPPYVVSPLLSGMPELADAALALDDLEYFSTQISIHRDPLYMPASPQIGRAHV